MQRRALLVGLLAVLAVVSTAQAAPVDDAEVDEIVDTSPLTETAEEGLGAVGAGSAAAADGAGSLAGWLGDAAGAIGGAAVAAASALADGVGVAVSAMAAGIAAAVAALAAGVSAGAGAIGGAAVTSGSVLLEATLAAAGAVAAAIGAAAAALADGLMAVIGHPAWDDPAVREGAVAAGAGVAAGAAGFSVWAWLERIGPFAGMGLYSRIQKSDLLENPVREEIFEFIQDHPGAHTSKIADELEIGWGTTVHHLKHLERHDMITKRKARNHTCYFENGGTYTPEEQEAMAALKNEKARRIVRHVRQQPGQSQKEVAEELSLSQSLVSWHVSKLEQAGLIGRRRNGKRRELMPADELRGVLGTAE